MSAPALREALVRVRAAAALGRRARSGPRRLRVSRIAALGDAQVLYGSVASTSRRPCPASTPSSTRSGANVASATSGATRSWPRAPPRRWSRSAWSLGPRRTDRRRRGGRRRVTDFERRATDRRGAVLATNGLLHDEVLQQAPLQARRGRSRQNRRGRPSERARPHVARGRAGTCCRPSAQPRGSANEFSRLQAGLTPSSPRAAMAILVNHVLNSPRSRSAAWPERTRRSRRASRVHPRD